MCPVSAGSVGQMTARRDYIFEVRDSGPLLASAFESIWPGKSALRRIKVERLPRGALMKFNRATGTLTMGYDDARVLGAMLQATRGEGPARFNFSIERALEVLTSVAHEGVHSMEPRNPREAVNAWVEAAELPWGKVLSEGIAELAGANHAVDLAQILEIPLPRGVKAKPASYLAYATAMNTISSRIAKSSGRDPVAVVDFLVTEGSGLRGVMRLLAAHARGTNQPHSFREVSRAIDAFSPALVNLQRAVEAPGETGPGVGRLLGWGAGRRAMTGFDRTLRSIDLNQRSMG